MANRTNTLKHDLSLQNVHEALLGSLASRQIALTWLYEQSGWRQWVLQYARTHGDGTVAGEDVFQESVILFDRNLREGRFQGGSSLQTYFLGIAKQVCFNRSRRSHSIVAFSPEMMGSTTDNPEKDLVEAERKDAVNGILSVLGDQCRKVLSLYKLSLSNEEIAKELGLSSPELAKKYCYRCREKFKAFVLSRPDLIELLNVKIDHGQ